MRPFAVHPPAKLDCLFQSTTSSRRPIGGASSGAHHIGPLVVQPTREALDGRPADAPTCTPDRPSAQSAPATMRTRTRRQGLPMVRSIVHPAVRAPSGHVGAHSEHGPFSPMERAEVRLVPGFAVVPRRYPTRDSSRRTGAAARGPALLHSGTPTQPAVAPRRRRSVRSDIDECPAPPSLTVWSSLMRTWRAGRISCPRGGAWLRSATQRLRWDTRRPRNAEPSSGQVPKLPVGRAFD